MPKVGELISFDLEKNKQEIFYNPNTKKPRLYSDNYKFYRDNSVSIKTLQKSITSGDNFKILDIRDRRKFDKKCIVNSIYYPAEKILEKGLDHISTDKILLVCEEGLISAMLANAMNQRSRDVYYLEGGMRAWNNELVLNC